jgi:uncharacterized membrane protein YfcA
MVDDLTEFRGVDHVEVSGARQIDLNGLHTTARDGMGRIGNAAYGALVGLLSVLMGIGGGAISNLILKLHGWAMHRAVAASAGVGVLIALPGTIGYLLAGWGQPGLPADAHGYVSISALIPTLPAALLCTRLGVSLAHALPQKSLKRLSGGFLLLVAIRFAWAIFQTN